VGGTGGHLACPEAPLYVGNSGTTARFLTAAATLTPGPVVIDGDPRMRERPIVDLTDALAALGAEVEIQGRNACPPVRVRGGGLPGGRAEIDAHHSSQYVSGVLLAAPYASQDVTLQLLDGVLVSKPYVDLTIEVMRAFGAEVRWLATGARRSLFVRAGRHYRARDYTVEPDASAAAYPFCAAAIAGGVVRVENIPRDSLQADFALLDLLEQMGCKVEREGDTVSLTGPDHGLRSLGEVDMNELPDAALAYSVVALFARGPTTIKNVGNLRIKETDRLAALEAELRRLGARADAGPDSLTVYPGPLHGAEIETYDDHRMAMSFSLAGLRVPGVIIRNPSCVSKTWPGYFDVFRVL
jgi:3-phosphoshikimate 1-carboxyvinyltransferase